jgi:hypothetical protein
MLIFSVNRHLHMLNKTIVTMTILCCCLLAVRAQESEPSRQDLFQRPSGGVRLEGQSVLAGIATVTRSVGLPLSVEYPLPEKISQPGPQLRTITATVGPGTVSQVLDALCNLDPTFAWLRTGNMVNVVARSLANDPRFFLNRKIDELTLENVRTASDAVFKTVAQLPGPLEQIAVHPIGMSLDFAKPWTVRLKDVTVREVLDQIAQQFGPSYGWQLYGAQNFRMITFHESLEVRSPH